MDPLFSEAAYDPRGFRRGIKRSRRDFERTLARVVNEVPSSSAQAFDATFKNEKRAYLRRLAEIFELINAVGLRHDQATVPGSAQDAFHLFHEALNLLTVALQTLRHGSDLGALGLARQALELAAVGLSAALNHQQWRQFRQGRLKATSCITQARKFIPMSGRLYGCLSEHHVHPSRRQIGTSVVPLEGSGWGIVVGAQFDLVRREQFAFGLLRLGQVAFCCHAAAELALLQFVNSPTFWKVQGDVEPHGLAAEWNPDEEKFKEFRRWEDSLASPEDPLAAISEHVSAELAAQLRQLIVDHSLQSLEDIEGLRRAQFSSGGTPLVTYLLAVALQNAGEYAEAESLYVQLRPTGPVHDVDLRLAWLYDRQGNRRHAAESYERHLALCPDDFGSLNNLGLVYDGLGDTTRAIECFRKAQAIHPGYFKACFNEANSHTKAGDLEEAVRKYDEAAKLAPLDPATLHNKGIVYLRKRDLTQAYRSFRRAVTIDPGYYASWLNLGAVAGQIGWPRKSAMCFNRALALFPESYEAHLNLAMVQHRLGNDQAAERHARSAAALRPELPDPWHVLGHVLDAQQRQEEANAAMTQWRTLSSLPGRETGSSET